MTGPIPDGTRAPTGGGFGAGPDAKKPAAKKRPAKKAASQPTQQQGQQQSQQATPQWFAKQVLTELGVPLTRSNVGFLVAWENREGGHWGDSARFNPICTTLDMPGATSINGPGVKAYTSWQEGIKATVDTLRLSTYSDIFGDLQNGTAAAGKTYSSLLKWSGGAYDSFAPAPNYHPSGGGSIDATASGGGGDGTAGVAGPLNLSDKAENRFGSQYTEQFLARHPEVHKLVAEAVAGQWSPAKFTAELKNTPFWHTEHITATVNQLSATAAAYGLNVGGDQINKWADGIISGVRTSAEFQKQMEAQAKSLYPYLGDWVDQGHTVADYYDAYAQVASSVLGVNPASIDLTKPMWREPLMQTDDKGNRVPMSLADWQTHLMQAPKYGFDSSPMAQQQATDFAGQIAQTFGAVG